MSKISVLVAALALAFSCGPTRHSPGGDDGTGGDGGNVNPGSGLGSSCATSTETAMSTPLDIYIMLDQSGSMDDSPNNPTKWQSVTSALKTFVGQTNLSGISVGIQYFALNNESCTAADYATADVEIAALPGVASAIDTSIGLHAPSTGTPTSAALQGAINHAQAWAMSHPGHTVVDVFATDGEPEECDTKLTDIDNIAKAGATGTPKILSFVIGVDDGTGNLTALNGIANAGGTGSAFIVNAGGSAEQQFVNALNSIRSTTLGCTYQIPAGSGVNPNQVNITYTPGSGGPAQVIPQVASMAACPATGNAWYYDNPSAPTQIILCTATCGTIEADTTGSVGITLGCQTVIQ